MTDDSNSVYAIAARVKNIARDWDASLTPMGEVLCNYYIIVLKDLYDFSENLKEPQKRVLRDILKSHEDMPRKIIELGKKKKG
jgi:hypothetical protein